jgi:hypothetical protein
MKTQMRLAFLPTSFCPEFRTMRSRRFAVVAIQCSAEPHAAIVCAVDCVHGRGNDRSVFETLMIALCVMVLRVFGDGTPYRRLPNADHPIGG